MLQERGIIGRSSGLYLSPDGRPSGPPGRLRGLATPEELLQELEALGIESRTPANIKLSKAIVSSGIGMDRYSYPAIEVRSRSSYSGHYLIDTGNIQQGGSTFHITDVSTNYKVTLPACLVRKDGILGFRDSRNQFIPFNQSERRDNSRVGFILVRSGDESFTVHPVLLATNYSQEMFDRSGNLLLTAPTKAPIVTTASPPPSRDKALVQRKTVDALPATPASTVEPAEMAETAPMTWDRLTAQISSRFSPSGFAGHIPRSDTDFVINSTETGINLTLNGVRRDLLARWRNNPPSNAEDIILYALLPDGPDQLRVTLGCGKNGEIVIESAAILSERHDKRTGQVHFKQENVPSLTKLTDPKIVVELLNHAIPGASPERSQSSHPPHHYDNSLADPASLKGSAQHRAQHALRVRLGLVYGTDKKGSGRKKRQHNTQPNTHRSWKR